MSSSVGVEEARDHLAELGALAVTAGARVTGDIIQEVDKPNPRTFVGPGKAEELVATVESSSVELVIFDGELSPSQQRNLEAIIDAKVVDRTALILDIFAQHAHSAEGKLQVELAQLQYRLPRLAGRGVELSRLGGGIGTRGPGEQKLEVDRRRIRTRINRLRDRLATLERSRRLRRKERRRSEVQTVSLVGYTNAGKSTLLNALTDADVLVEDKLFATLDSTSRRINLSHHRPVVISDTVGFIRKLPHQLIAAFHSTLEEVVESQLLVHVIDAGHPQRAEQWAAVEDVLDELGAGAPRLEVFNKVDLVDDPERESLRTRFPEAILVSALTRDGLGELLEAIDRKLGEGLEIVTVSIPYSEGGLLSRLHGEARIIEERHEEAGTVVTAEVSRRVLTGIKDYLVRPRRPGSRDRHGGGLERPE